MKKLKNQPLEQFSLFPSTRYMGSKNKIILNIKSPEGIRDFFYVLLNKFGMRNLKGTIAENGITNYTKEDF